jgi:phosphotransferase system HPr-like phosphotransfer protein
MRTLLMTLATQAGADGRVEGEGNAAEKVIKALGLGFNKSIAF